MVSFRPAFCCLRADVFDPFPRATKEIGDVCTQASVLRYNCYIILTLNFVVAALVSYLHFLKVLLNFVFSRRSLSRCATSLKLASLAFSHSLRL